MLLVCYHPYRVCSKYTSVSRCIGHLKATFLAVWPTPFCRRLHKPHLK